MQRGPGKEVTSRKRCWIGTPGAMPAMQLGGLLERFTRKGFSQCQQCTSRRNAFGHLVRKFEMRPD